MEPSFKTTELSQTPFLHEGNEAPREAGPPAVHSLEKETRAVLVGSSTTLCGKRGEKAREGHAS